MTKIRTNNNRILFKDEIKMLLVYECSNLFTRKQFFQATYDFGSVMYYISYNSFTKQ